MNFNPVRARPPVTRVGFFNGIFGTIVRTHQCAYVGYINIKPRGWLGQGSVKCEEKLLSLL